MFSDRFSSLKIYLGINILLSPIILIANLTVLSRYEGVILQKQ
ncbi:hypothetical protein SPLC1_S207780 [Arthrospira platensis C1]|nr:hypothetical protein SPLC1_S207780 [Arthrospira platensis C1]